MPESIDVIDGVILEGETASKRMIQVRLNNDAHNRFEVLADGTIKQGNGGSAPSTFTGGGGGASEAVSVIGNSGSSQSIDVSTYQVATLTLNANCTLTLTGAVAGSAYTITLIATQDGTGSRTITWPASTRWAAGSPPVLSTAASSVDVISLTSVDGGTSWYGFLSGKAFA